MCFINDTKYNITGILTTDVTWDALVKNTLKHFLNPLIIEETEKRSEDLKFLQDTIHIIN